MKQKNIHNSVKTYDVWLKKMVFESLWSGCVISEKIVFWGAWVGPKK